MSISSLSSQYISASFAGLLQYSSSGNVYDGNGNQITTINVASGADGSIQYASGSKFKSNTGLLFNENSISLQVGGSTATGEYALSSGKGISSGDLSLSGGYLTEARGFASVAFGDRSIAIASGSVAIGQGTVASGSYQTVFGKYNTGNSSSLLIVGNGTGAGSESNAFEVTTSGSIVLNAYQTGGSKPGRAGQNGEIIIVHDGSNPWLYIYLDVVGDWKGIQLTA